MTKGVMEVMVAVQKRKGLDEVLESVRIAHLKGRPAMGKVKMMGTNKGATSRDTPGPYKLLGV